MQTVAFEYRHRDPRIEALAPLLLALGCASASTAAPTGAEPDNPTAVNELDPIDGVSAECSGADLDLGQIVREQRCSVTGEPRPVSADNVEASIAPAPLDLSSGETGTVQVVIRNTSGRSIALDFAIGCDPAWGFRGRGTQADVSRDLPLGPAERIDEWPSWCAHTVRCGPRTIRVGLSPSGRAFMPLAVQARDRGLNDACESVGTEPLPPGTYSLEVDVPYWGESGRAGGVLRIH